MTDTNLIILATAIIVAYFFVTSILRRHAEAKRLEALSFAKKLLVNEATPDEVKSFLAKEDYMSSRGFAPWLVAVALPFLGIASLFSDRDNEMLDAVEKVGKGIPEMFDGYLNSATKSILFRSPLALLIIAAELAVLGAILMVLSVVLSNARDGMRSVFTYLFIRLDDYHQHGLTGHQHRG